MNPRLKRLQKDYEKLLELAARSPFVSIEDVKGDPPHTYILHLTCMGITDVTPDGCPLYSESHKLGIHLHEGYPRKGPLFQMITPVYHPNIGKNGLVCIGDEGDHGFAPSMGLDDLVVRIVQIIRYENVSLYSTFNTLAAIWARENMGLFPLDTRQIMGDELVEVKILDEIVDPHDGDELGIIIIE